MANINIIGMASGTVIKNKRNGLEYVLGNYVNDVAREITQCGVIGSFATDYINKNTQADYEIVQTESNAEKFKYLSQCDDFNLLLEHYSSEQLAEFEQAIKEYEESECSEENFEKQAYYGFSDIINWYEGTMDTEQLFDYVEAY